jgi:hypothetical protein
MRQNYSLTPLTECQSDTGRFRLRRGIGFAGLDGRKDCVMPGTETGESKSRAKGGSGSFLFKGLTGAIFFDQVPLLSNHRYAIIRHRPVLLPSEPRNNLG